MKKPLILIAGPTGSGKTKTSVLLAQKIGGEIISADSMQVYRGMDIGTAKVKKEEMDGVPHYMIDVIEPCESCNVSWFKEQVTLLIDTILERGNIPILVGGTGFYINAILYDTQFEEMQEDNTYRLSLQKLADTKGAQYLHEKLKEVDALSAETIHFNNIKRVIRALEYYHQTGEPISSHNALEKSKRSENTSLYDYTFFALSMARDTLYKRIDLRVEQMVEEGLVEEVRSFFDRGFNEEMTAMKAIGYKEIFPYFRNEMSLEPCIDKLKQSTRQYAKRQLTWLKHQVEPTFIEVDLLAFDAEKIVEKMLIHLKEKA